MYKYLLAASLVSNFGASLFGPLYAVYVEEIGGSLLDIGNTVALYTIMNGILIILFGKLSDNYNKGMFATLGLFIGALCNLGYIFISTPLQLYVLQIGFALSNGILFAPFAALFAKHIDENKSGFLWALEGGGSRILAGIGIMLGVYITHLWGFQTVFIIMFTIQIIATLITGRMWTLSRN